MEQVLDVLSWIAIAGGLFFMLVGTIGITDPAALDLWTAVNTGLTDQQISNDPGGDRWLRLIDTAVDLFCDHVGIPPEGEQT